MSGFDNYMNGINSFAQDVEANTALSCMQAKQSSLFIKEEESRWHDTLPSGDGLSDLGRSMLEKISSELSQIALSSRFGPIRDRDFSFITKEAGIDLQGMPSPWLNDFIESTSEKAEAGVSLTHAEEELLKTARIGNWLGRQMSNIGMRVAGAGEQMAAKSVQKPVKPSVFSSGVGKNWGKEVAKVEASTPTGFASGAAKTTPKVAPKPGPPSKVPGEKPTDQLVDSVSKDVKPNTRLGSIGRWGVVGLPVVGGGAYLAGRSGGKEAGQQELANALQQRMRRR